MLHVREPRGQAALGVLEAVHELNGALLLAPPGIGEEPERHQEAVFFVLSKGIAPVGGVGGWSFGDGGESVVIAWGLLSAGSVQAPYESTRWTQGDWG